MRSLAPVAWLIPPSNPCGAAAAPRGPRGSPNWKVSTFLVPNFLPSNPCPKCRPPAGAPPSRFRPSNERCAPLSDRLHLVAQFTLVRLLGVGRRGGFPSGEQHVQRASGRPLGRGTAAPAGRGVPERDISRRGGGDSARSSSATETLSIMRSAPSAWPLWRTCARQPARGESIWATAAPRGSGPGQLRGRGSVGVPGGARPPG